MSIANLFVRPTGAYLITDEAGIHGDGTLRQVRRKVCSSGRLRIAITFSGVMGSHAEEFTSKWLAGFRDQTTAMRALPELLQIHVAVLEAMLLDPVHGPTIASLQKAVSMFVAIWSQPRRQAEGYVMAGYPGHLPDRVGIGRLHPTSQYVQPAVTGIAGDFTPSRKAAIDLVERQRLIRDEAGRHHIGGGAHLTKVDASGVQTVRLLKWPDTVGERIAA